MFSKLSRLFFAFATVALVGVVAHANPVSRSDTFRLTEGDSRTFQFVPGGAGPITLQANFRGAGVIRKEIAIRMTLIKPDGSTRVQVGGSPLVLRTSLSASEAASFKGKAFKVLLENNVAQKDTDTVTGDLDTTFEDGKRVVLNVNDLDVGPKATQDKAFTVPAQAGKVTVDIAFRDGVANGKDLIAELARVSDGKILARTTGDSGLKLIANLTGADTKLEVRMTNAQTLRTVRGIDLHGVFQAK